MATWCTPVHRRLTDWQTWHDNFIGGWQIYQYGSTNLFLPIFPGSGEWHVKKEINGNVLPIPWIKILPSLCLKAHMKHLADDLYLFLHVEHLADGPFLTVQGEADPAAACWSPSTAAGAAARPPTSYCPCPSPSASPCGGETKLLNNQWRSLNFSDGDVNLLFGQILTKTVLRRGVHPHAPSLNMRLIRFNMVQKAITVFGVIFAENCMKIKEIKERGVRIPSAKSPPPHPHGSGDAVPQHGISI